jgi:hypothetical protein
MAEKLRLFVSATNDLEAERAVIGRAVAELPISIGIEIRRTPATGASYDDIFELVANVDRVYFLLGRDITAPAGAEWHWAWKLERSVWPLASNAVRSPAAQEFMRSALVKWRIFRSSSELARLVTLDLARILNHPTNRYGLSVTELELLALHAKRRTRRPAPGLKPDDPGGAQGGGVLLDLAETVTMDGEELDSELLTEP